MVKETNQNIDIPHLGGVFADLPLHGDFSGPSNGINNSPLQAVKNLMGQDIFAFMGEQFGHCEGITMLLGSSFGLLDIYIEPPVGQPRVRICVDGLTCSQLVQHVVAKGKGNQEIEFVPSN